jgi:hypothetical protein
MLTTNSVDGDFRFYQSTPCHVPETVICVAEGSSQEAARSAYWDRGHVYFRPAVTYVPVNMAVDHNNFIK